MRFISIHAANPGPFTGEGNWTYLIPGPAPILIDAGVGRAAHLDALADATPEGPTEVLVTHAHSDHASGAPAIRSRWPAAVFRKHPWIDHDARFEVSWQAIVDGARIDTDEGPIEAIHTPGHSPDHLAFWHAESRTLFVGDLLISGNTVFIPASSGGSLSQYLDSLRRLAALAPRLALPAHGPPIQDPVKLITHYLEHRRRREEQVVSALESGLATVQAIADRIYAGHASEVMPMAKESVLAHLHKLEHEGFVRREGDRWLIV